MLLSLEERKLTFARPPSFFQTSIFVVFNLCFSFFQDEDQAEETDKTTIEVSVIEIEIDKIDVRDHRFQCIHIYHVFLISISTFYII